MQKKKTFMSVAILLAVLMLGIGYANISSISLNITGTAAASPDTANYVVKFTGTPSVSDENYASAEITGDHSAEITVTV